MDVVQTVQRVGTNPDDNQIGRRSRSLEIMPIGQVVRTLFFVRFVTTDAQIRQLRVTQICALAKQSMYTTYPNVIHGNRLFLVRFNQFIDGKKAYTTREVVRWLRANPPDRARYQFMPDARRLYSHLTIFDLGDKQRCEDILAQPTPWELRHPLGLPVTSLAMVPTLSPRPQRARGHWLPDWINT